MSDMTSFVIGIALVVGFLAFGAVMYSTAAVQGGYADNAADYKLLNSSMEYYNQSKNFSDELQLSVEQSQQTNPSIALGLDLGLASAAITKTLTFLFSSLKIAVAMVLSTGQIFAIFGVPDWIGATIIVCISLLVGMGIIAAIIRWNP